MYSPSPWDWTMFLGTIGFFFTLIFLFVRFLPVISIFEVKTLVPDAKVHDTHNLEHTDVRTIDRAES
jgi:molybdopterin-containing oxidoreductase family membrane subunit